MKSVALALLIGGAAAVAGVAASLGGRTVRKEVAGHRFEIPKDYLFDEAIPWLPLPESDSFTFLLHPNQDADHIPAHRFLVEPLARRCLGNGGAQMVRIACGFEKSNLGDGPPYEMRQSELGSWASDLYSVGETTGKTADDARQVAYCQRFEPNPAKPKASTLCTTVWAYKRMMLQFSFDEEELPNMVAMKQAAMQLLDSWELR